MAILWHKNPPELHMKKEATKATEAQLLDLLKIVLPKATHDPELAGKIYKAVEGELKSKARVNAFEKFCAKVELPDLELKTIRDVKTQLAASFGDGDVKITPNEKEQTLGVEVVMPDGTEFTNEIKVNPNAGIDPSEEQEITFKFVPFPVCLPGDQELVWFLAKRETMTPEEAGMALAKIEEDYWASKAGQKMLRDRVERSFPEFIARVPAGMLAELGLKRHYKTPEAIKALRTLAAKKQAADPSKG
jgi:hypothetical protein